jgi:hypothetical protein
VRTNRANGNAISESRNLTIKTSLLEILQALTSQTQDDALVMESLANIFSSYRVRFGRALAPVLLTSGKPTRSLRRGNLGRRSAAWA